MSVERPATTGRDRNRDRNRGHPDAGGVASHRREALVVPGTPIDAPAQRLRETAQGGRP
jgi:hypothetical protein